MIVDNIMEKPVTLHNMPDILLGSEVAEIFRISKLTLKRWGNRGDIKFFRINSRGDRRYNRKEVLKKLNNYEI